MRRSRFNGYACLVRNLVRTGLISGKGICN